MVLVSPRIEGDCEARLFVFGAKDFPSPARRVRS